MQNYSTSETAGLIVYDRKLETVPGGVCIAAAELVQTRIKSGTPVGKDSNGLYHVVKCAKAQANATNTATDYRVVKGHNFKAGDILASATGAKAYAITAVTTSNTDYDILTVGTTIGVAITAGDIFLQSATESNTTGSALKYTPVGLTGEDNDITTGDNVLASVVVRSSVREANIPPIHTAVKTLLPQMRFVS